MKKPKTPPTEEQIQDSARLRNLFEARAGMSQLEFGQQYGIGNQGMIWQYLNAHKPKGSVLNVFAAIKFAEGLRCQVSDFSPSIQLEIDRISAFSTLARGGTVSEKQNIATAHLKDTVTPSYGPAHSEVEPSTFDTSFPDAGVSKSIEQRYSDASYESKALVDIALAEKGQVLGWSNKHIERGLSNLLEDIKEALPETKKLGAEKAA